MARRFTATEKWTDDWFLSLTNDNRIIWQYLIDTCSTAGLIKPSMRHLNFCCNTNITEEDLKIIFNGRLLPVGDYYFIPKFISFQYPQGILSEKPAIVGVRKELDRFGLFDGANVIYNDDVIIANRNATIKDKDKTKTRQEKEKKRPEIFTPPTFEEVSTYCKERNNNVDPKKFIDTNIAKGWKVGKTHTPMKDWRAAIRTWEGNRQDGETPIIKLKSAAPVLEQMKRWEKEQGN